MSINLKTLIRNILSKTGVSRTKLYIKLYRKKFGNENIDHLLEIGRKNTFEKIYETGVWLHGENAVALSGHGSEEFNTIALRSKLRAMLVDLQINTLLDVGCGDWTWMSKIDLPCNYIGVDVVDALIERNKLRFCKNPGVQFLTLDAVDEKLPSADAVLLREVVFHLSFRDIFKMFGNVAASGAKYVLITSDVNVLINSDIVSGDFRCLNLAAKPFNFPPPQMVVDDDECVVGRVIGVWKINQLKGIAGF